ncbi:hypothetical protein JCM17204_19120 [Blautia stercoris]
MIRKLLNGDIDRVAEIWLKTNLKAHYFISNQYWKSNYELVKEMMSQSEVYVYEADKMIQGFIGLNDEYIEGIFVSDEMQSCGIGKLLLDYIKDKKERLQLNVYQKNARAISFYQREGFIIEGEGLDEATGEKEYTMLWKQNRNRNFYKELIQKAGAETELVYMKASKELLQKRLYKRNQVLNANSPFVITDEILEHHYHAFQEPWGEGEKVILQKEDIMQYSKEESKAIWNQNAEFWDCAMGDESNDFHREVVRPKVTELLNPDPTDYILDIACGNGNYSAYLAEKAVSVLAFDYSEKMVELAKKRQKRYADHIEFCVADATNETSLMALKRNKPFTKAVVQGVEVLALAPLSVLPDYQNRGIGLSLMKEGHSIAHKLGYEYSVVLGHSKYYPKAGYIPASECGIKAPFEVDDESFMALNLNGSQNKLNGVIEYDKAFGV